MERLAYLTIGAAMSVIIMTVAPLLTDASTGPDEEYVGMDSVCMASEAPEAPASAQAADDKAGGMTMAAGDTAHDHPLRPVSEDLPVPGVSHLMFPDAMDGYNIQILPTNFTFTPAAINRPVEENAGHAHVYVNGVKIARVYSTWFHLPGALLQSGDNLVTVSLNANDHSVWSTEGGAIASTVVVPGPPA